MIERIVEIAEDHRYLSLHRGFLRVTDAKPPRDEIGKVPIDDIGAVVAHAHGLSYSNNLLAALAERGIPFVLCSKDHNVVGILWPTAGHHQQTKRIAAQIAAKKPVQKQLWAFIVKAKLQTQASVLDTIGLSSEPVRSLTKKVKSGDPGNIEAQAARRYWPILMGQAFRRDPKQDGINALLNYGYSVYRAAIARAVVAVGLHPGVGIHHCNERNSLCLVDDLIEPFRPLVDYQVWRLVKKNCEEAPTVNPETKRALVNSLYWDVVTKDFQSPVTICMQNMALSLVKVYLSESDKLIFPPIEVHKLTIG